MLRVGQLAMRACCGVSRHGIEGSRGLSCSSTLQSPSRAVAKLKNLQAHYQCLDGAPIFLKAGLRDRLLYSATLVLCVIGVFGTLATIYDHAKPSSWKQAC